MAKLQGQEFRHDPGSMPATVRWEPDRDVYALRHVGPYRTILKSFRRVGARAAGRGQRPTCVLTVFCDDPKRMPARSLESYACMEVAGVRPPPADSAPGHNA